MQGCVEAMKTFMQLLAQHAMHRPDAPAMRHKALGIWQVWTWRGLDEHCTRLACGLHQVGLKSGQRMAVLGGNAPNFYAALIASQALGVVPVPIHPDASDPEVEEALAACDAKVAIAQDQEQVDKLFAARWACPQLAQVFYDNGRGLRGYPATEAEPLHAVVERGAHFAVRHPGFMEIQRSRTRPADDAVSFPVPAGPGSFRLSSLAHQSLIDRAQASARGIGLGARDEVMACAPLSRPGQFLCGFAQWLVCGFTLSCPESAESIQADMREVGPTYLFGPPGMYQAMYSEVARRLETAGAIQRRALALARRAGQLAFDRRRPTPSQRVAQGLANAGVFAPLRNGLGLARVRAAHVADGDIGRDARAFFLGLGVPITDMATQGLTSHDAESAHSDALEVTA